jgi:2-polyprenyl-6-methoxyphenol hydroxylase-like FAD-dependent oxidoreductase
LSAAATLTKPTPPPTTAETPTPQQREPVLTIFERSAPGRRAAVLPAAGAVLARVERFDQLLVNEVARVDCERWADGRVVLLGDAGYSPSPLTGLGTSLALVGAYVLAGELAAAGGNHATAFAAYEREMRDYVAQCQKLPPGGIKGMLPRGAAGIRLRDLSMRMMTRWPMRQMLAKQFQKSDGIVLKDSRTARGAAV